MTNIERLAEKYYQDRPEGFGDPIEDYKAGFRKAKELLFAEITLMTADGGWLAQRLENFGEEGT